MGPLLVADRLAFADLVEEGGLDAAEAEVQPGSPWPGERHRPRVAGCRQLVDRWAAGKGQAQDAGTFVERLPSGVVARAADHGDLPVRLPTDQVAVTAGDDQPQHRRGGGVILQPPPRDTGGRERQGTPPDSTP